MTRKIGSVFSNTSLRFFLFLGLIFNYQWLSAQEICNNGLDDDGDGYIDCFDSDCTGNSACSDFYYGSPSPPCQFIPPNSNLALTSQWVGGPVSGHSVLVTGDLDGDGYPEIVGRNQNLISGSNQQGLGGANGIRIFDGRDGSLKFTPNTLHIPFTNTGFVIADADSDGNGEFYYITAWNTPSGDDRKLVCYEYNPVTKNFDLKWKSNVKIGNSTAGVFYSPEIADFNQDGVPELYAGNQIFNSQNGNEISNGGLNNSKGWSYCEFFHPAAFTIAFDVLSSSSILPSTGNPCGAPCNGLELIAGNVVYTVDISSGVMNIAMQAPSSVPDGNTTILDYDLDGDIDAAITSIEGGKAKLFIWDLQTSSLLANPLILQTVDNMGRANVGDFDNDGKPELGICTERYYRVVDDYTQINAGNMTYLWTLSTSDNSGMTNATVFDFDGNGSFEIVYRDEQNLRILKGIDGSQLASIPCASPTAGEYPLVADIDADGETEIVCSCGGVVNGQIKAFKSNNKPWIAARKVWNQHSYFNVNINEDLTVPRVQQSPHLEFPSPGSGRRPLNIFLAQSTILDSSGQIAFPAADAQTIIINTACVNDSIEVTFTIKNNGSIALSNQLPIAVYHKNPLILSSSPFKIITTNNVISPGDSFNLSVFVSKAESNVYLVANDNGSIARPYNLGTQFPITSIGECNFLNNIDSSLLSGSGNNLLYTRDLCLGDTFQLLTNPSPGITYQWSGNMYISDVNDFFAKIYTAVNDTVYLLRQDPVCPSVTGFILQVHPIPSIQISSSSISICEGDSLQLIKTATNESSSFWDFAPFKTDTNNTVTFYPSANFYAVAEARNGSCLHRDSIAINIKAKAQYTPLNDTSSCIGNVLNLGYGAGLNGQIYSWTPGTALSRTDSSSTQATVQGGITTYIIEINRANCISKDTINISGITPPSGPSLKDTTYCDGDTLNLNFNANLLYTYLWFPGSRLLDSNKADISILPGYNGYISRVISDGGCESRDSFFINLKPKPDLKIFSETKAICAGDSVKISLSGGEWYSIPYLSIDKSSDSVYTFKPASELQLIIIADSASCRSQDSLELKFAEEPNLNLDSIYWLCNEEAFNFIQEETGVNYRYFNPFGIEVLMPDTSGTYNVIAYNACTQKSADFEVYITTEANCQLFFPNAFTPNLNLNNDSYPFGEMNLRAYAPCQFSLYLIKIYSRWGELVFESDSPDKQWDGTFKGEPAESGVYIYYVQYRYLDACEHGPIKLNKRGNITLLR